MLTVLLLTVYFHTLYCCMRMERVHWANAQFYILNRRLGNPRQHSEKWHMESNWGNSNGLLVSVPQTCSSQVSVFKTQI